MPWCITGPAWALLVVCLALTSPDLGAQEGAPTESQWSVVASTITKPPTIDGVVDPDEWAGCVVLDDFRQVEPGEGTIPSERTEVRVACDADTLYFAFVCHDSRPDEIRRSLRTRDIPLDPDDRVEIILDTFRDRRNAYFFQLGAAGAQGDGLLSPGFFTKDWDGIWEGRVVVGTFGWSGEMAIPAKTLSMGSEHPRFGLNIVRYIKRTNEEIQWASPRRNTKVFDVASAGDLVGVGGLEQGIGLDVRPFVAATTQYDWDENRTDVEIEPGLDLTYRLTASLQFALTINTDFAETEVDDRIVQLTRFPVFFPEKRDFFLQDAGIFDFGIGSRGTLPFFSRRVGLSPSGTPVPILAGVKLTGRVGRLGIGVLDVLQDENDNVDRQNLAVLRATYDILTESRVGVIMTHGDPSGRGENAVAGVDFTYRTRKLFGNQVLRVDLFAIGTHDRPDAGETEIGYDVGVRVDYPNDVWRWNLRYELVSDDYRPDLGFVSRRGNHTVRGVLDYRPRVSDGPIRRFLFGLELRAIWRLDDGDVETLDGQFRLLGLQLQSEDEFFIAFEPSSERLVEPFEIRDGVVIREGEYDFERFSVNAEFADKRPLSGSASFTTGSFFDGRRDTYEASLSWLIQPGLRVGLGFEHNDIRLSAGQFETNLVSLRTTVDFSPDVSWSILAQWDDESDTLGINSRVRWIVKPGSEVFFVVNHGFSTASETDSRFRLEPLTTEITVKAAWTFRF